MAKRTTLSHAQGIWYIHLLLVISFWPAQIEAKSMIYTSGHGPSFGAFKGSEHADPSFMSVDHDATFGNSASCEHVDPLVLRIKTQGGKCN